MATSTHKYLLLVVSLLLMNSFAIGQSIEKNLIKSFDISNAKTIQFNTTQELDIAKWDKNHVRIQMTIYLENGDQKMLTTYLKQGRYKIIGNPSEAGFQIETPHLEDLDIETYERITYRVFVPEGVVVENTQTGFAFLP